MLTHYDRERIIWNSSLDASEKLLMLALNSFVDGEGKCFPSHSRLAEKTSQGRRTVQRVIEKGIAQGYIKKEARKKPDSLENLSNVYTIDFSKIPSNPSGDRPSKKGKEGSDMVTQGGMVMVTPPIATMTQGGMVTMTIGSVTVAQDLSNDLSNIYIYPENKERVSYADAKDAIADSVIEKIPSCQNSEPARTSPGQVGEIKSKCSAAPRSRKKQKSEPSVLADEFEAWWKQYREFCYDVNAEPGSRGQAIAVWDELMPDNLEAVKEGTEYYCAMKRAQFARKGEAIGVSHGIRYLRDRKWQEALEYKQRQAKATVDGANLTIIPAPVNAFCGPWGNGFTPAQKEFDAWLQEQAEAKGLRDPAGWSFKIIEAISKGGPQSKWDEFQKSKSEPKPAPAPDWTTWAIDDERHRPYAEQAVRNIREFSESTEENKQYYEFWKANSALKRYWKDQLDPQRIELMRFLAS